MKGKRLKDVLDEKPMSKEKWDIIFGKLKKLGTAMEMVKGEKMNIDDPEYRWVNDRIEYMSKGGKYAYKLTKEDMEQANELWRIYR